MYITCPSCFTKHTLHIGELPQINIFAGKTLTIDLPQSSLFKCKNCNLYFRWPRLNSDQSSRLYQEGNSDKWRYELRDRIDWQIAINWINRKVFEGSILDIGCWEGKFLKSLQGNWKLYGIEINLMAANKALSKGITIIADNIYEMNDASIKFDITTAFDFIEHVEYPLDFIASVSRMTKKNGYIIISSGNTDALPWKINRNKYWYSAIPEHISFINIGWCHFVASRLNLQIKYRERFSHANKRSLPRFLLDTLKNGVYLVAPEFFGELRKIKNSYLHKRNSNNTYDYPPSWITSKDHLIIIFQKS